MNKLKFTSLVLALVLMSTTLGMAELIGMKRVAEMANAELQALGVMGANENYFEETNRNSLPFSTSAKLTSRNDFIVYGSPHGSFSSGEQRYYGYSMSGDWFANKFYPFDAISQRGLWDRVWIEDPQYDDRTSGRPDIKGDGYFNNNPLFENSIRIGLQESSRKKSDGSLLDFPTDKLDQREWYKYVHIYQPPTSVSWGCGIMFHEDSAGKVWYYTVPLSPAGMGSDLAAEFVDLPSQCPAGYSVRVQILVTSNFLTAQANVPYALKILNSTTNQEVSATYTGSATTKEGLLTFPEKGQSVIYADFIMPESDVAISFDVNKAGTAPKESNLINNILTSGESIKLVDPVLTGGEFEIDYNVLTRQIFFSLDPNTANLTLPRGSWNGNATGALNTTNGSTNIYKNFTVVNNPTVNEASTSVTRTPEIHTTIRREDFGDNPLQSIWSPLLSPWSKLQNGITNFSGSIRRPYVYTYYCGGCRSDGNGGSYCPGHTRYGTATASFDSGTDTRAITVKGYAGLTTVPAKTYDNSITGNTRNSLLKELSWTSDPYLLNVIRWMCHIDENDAAYDWTPVPGKYKRTFTQQNTGTVEVEATSTLANDYQRSREAALNRDYRKSEYDKAVFASDANFRNVDYPIKSGYYFNPTGTYTFTVETTTYKNTTADTKDHKDLVDALIKSFRYESDLVYINNNKDAVNLQNETRTKSGSAYQKDAASLTAQDPTGIDGALILNVLDRSDNSSRYTKDVEELDHTEASGGYTHDFFLNILEGYTESGTESSLDNYKYREYIKDRQHIYKITEKTTVTIEINKNNRNTYTHLQMADGQYTIRAWLADINLGATTNAYKVLGSLKGIVPLDQITVTVKGSMLEDSN